MFGRLGERVSILFGRLGEGVSILFVRLGEEVSIFVRFGEGFLSCLVDILLACLVDSVNRGGGAPVLFCVWDIWGYMGLGGGVCKAETNF